MRGRSRIHFDRHPLAMLLGAIVLVGLLAAIVVVGPGGVFDWLVNFLLPMAVILLVVVGTIGLAVQGGSKVLDGRDQPSPTNVRNRPRGGGLSNPVYWLLMSLFLLASVAMACFFWLVIRDQWIHDRLLVAGRFDEGETLRMVFVLLATVSVSSGLLWRHYRRIDAYGSPLETFFMLVFTLCAGLAAVAVLPALFAG
jgi:magnesium-transporting ATPase (P-type)